MVQPNRVTLPFACFILSCLVLATSCGTQDEPDTSTSDAGSFEMQAPTDTAGDMTVVPADGGQDGSTSLQDQKRDAQVRALLNRADRLISERRYTAAGEAVAEVLRLDPDNEEAQAKQQVIDAAEGASELAQDAVQEKTLMRQRQRAEVRDRLTRAEQLFELGEFQEAKDQLEVADTLIRYDAYQTDYGTLKGDVRDLMATVDRRLAETAARREAEEYEDAYERLRQEEERERADRVRRVREMMIEGFEAFERQDFDRAEDLAERVLAMAPSYVRAKDLREFARQARHAAWRKTYYEQRREVMQSWKQQMRDSQIPWHHIIRFPERNVWDRITEVRRNRVSGNVAQEDSATVSELKNRLANETVTFDFSDMTIAEAIDNIRDTRNVNILMSKTAREEKGEEPADLVVRDLNFGDALQTLLEPQELTYIFKYDMIFIVGRAESSGETFPVVYEVRDLTISLPNFQAPDLTLPGGVGGDEAAARIFGGEGDPTRETEPEVLADLVRDNVSPLSWEIEDRSIELNSGQLVVVTTADVHRQIEQFLESLRQFSKVVVHVETRFISIREGFLNEIGLDIRGGGGSNGNIALLDDVTNGNDDNASAGLDNNGNPLPASASQSPSAGAFFQDGDDLDFRARNENIFNRALGSMLSSTGGATIGFSFLDDLELNVIFRAVEKSVFANVLRAPRLTIYNNQRANLTLVNQVTYVKDYDVEVAQTAFIADPLVDIIQDGLVLDVRPTVSADRKYVTLELRPTVAILGRPIRTFVTPLAGLTTSVTIELPELEYRSAATTVKVPDGGNVVIGGLQRVTTVDRRSETPILSQIPILSFFFSRKGRSDEISDLIVVLSVHIVDLEEEERRLVR